VGQHSSASASRLLGLDGFEILAAEVVGGEWQLDVETIAAVVGCRGCGVRAELHGRRTVRVRDLPFGGRPVVLCWRKDSVSFSLPICLPLVGFVPFFRVFGSSRPRRARVRGLRLPLTGHGRSAVTPP
jgi:hypothetical protein